MNHDPLCYVAMNGGSCCPWMPECDCQCMCEYIKEVRNDTLDAAEAAVETSNGLCSGLCECVEAGVAAIRALKEKNND